LSAPRAGDDARPRADRVIVVDDRSLADYTADGYAGALTRLVGDASPMLVVTGHTSKGYDFMPRVAARLGRPLVPACTAWEFEGDRLLLTRQIFNARLGMRVAVGVPAFATALPGAFSRDPAPSAAPESADAAADGGNEADDEDPIPPAGRSAGSVVPEGQPLPVRTFAVDFDAIPIRVSVVQRGEAAPGSADLSSAAVIVAAGRGLKEKENLSIVRDLADALGGALGASRPVVDAEWLPREYQIGSSGQTVAPKLYVAVGISGAVQHLVGMQSARCIVAINKDADAPIFKVAHYGIVDDLFKVVPEITRTIRALRGSVGTGPKPV
jgi:electron transfer flavoprotein alpha subunit